METAADGGGESENRLKRVRDVTGDKFQFKYVRRLTDLDHLEIELFPTGIFRYSRDSYLGKGRKVIDETGAIDAADVERYRYIVTSSKIINQNDNSWPKPESDGWQKLEITLGDQHISFTTKEIIGISDIRAGPDAPGLASFFRFVKELMKFTFPLVERVFGRNPLGFDELC